MKQRKVHCKTELGRFLGLPPAMEEEVVHFLKSSQGRFAITRRRRSSDNMYGVHIYYKNLQGLGVPFPTDDPFEPFTHMLLQTDDEQESIDNYRTVMRLAGHGDAIRDPEIDALFEGLDDDEEDFFAALDDDDNELDFFKDLEDDEEPEDVLQALSEFGKNMMVYDVETDKYYTILNHNGTKTTLRQWDSKKVAVRSKTEKRYLAAHMEDDDE